MVRSLACSCRYARADSNRCWGTSARTVSVAFAGAKRTRLLRVVSSIGRLRTRPNATISTRSAALGSGGGARIDHKCSHSGIASRGSASLLFVSMGADKLDGALTLVRVFRARRLAIMSRESQELMDRLWKDFKQLQVERRESRLRVGSQREGLHLTGGIADLPSLLDYAGYGF